jgi:hypothetical protein
LSTKAGTAISAVPAAGNSIVSRARGRGSRPPEQAASALIENQSEELDILCGLLALPDRDG